ncbi:hypothetical protein B0H11DRAFT_2322497 [Mycena galericulata]|nr:hypothetical protein B0H11DRAFT_2322497 [Mycena galericulata]
MSTPSTGAISIPGGSDTAFPLATLATLWSSARCISTSFRGLVPGFKSIIRAPGRLPRVIMLLLDSSKTTPWFLHCHNEFRHRSRVGAEDSYGGDSRGIDQLYLQYGALSRTQTQAASAYDHGSFRSSFANLHRARSVFTYHSSLSLSVFKLIVPSSGIFEEASTFCKIGSRLHPQSIAKIKFSGYKDNMKNAPLYGLDEPSDLRRVPSLLMKTERGKSSPNPARYMQHTCAWNAVGHANCSGTSAAQQGSTRRGHGWQATTPDAHGSGRDVHAHLPAHNSFSRESLPGPRNRPALEDDMKVEFEVVYEEEEDAAIKGEAITLRVDGRRAAV